MKLQLEQFLDNLHGLCWAFDSMANGAGVGVDLVIVSARACLVAEKVNVLVCDTSGLLSIILEMTQAVGLVPTSREDIERDLATDREAAYILEGIS